MVPVVVRSSDLAARSSSVRRAALSCKFSNHFSTPKNCHSASAFDWAGAEEEAPRQHLTRQRRTAHLKRWEHPRAFAPSSGRPPPWRPPRARPSVPFAGNTARRPQRAFRVLATFSLLRSPESSREVEPSSPGSRCSGTSTSMPLFPSCLLHSSKSELSSRSLRTHSRQPRCAPPMRRQSLQ